MPAMRRAPGRDGCLGLTSTRSEILGRQSVTQASSLIGGLRPDDTYQRTPRFLQSDHLATSEGVSADDRVANLTNETVQPGHDEVASGAGAVWVGRKWEANP